MFLGLGNVLKAGLQFVNGADTGQVHFAVFALPATRQENGSLRFPCGFNQGPGVDFVMNRGIQQKRFAPLPLGQGEDVVLDAPARAHDLIWCEVSALAHKGSAQP